ncbi:peptidoglycan editing factor PgeF [Paenibacillus sp. JX-17]|uniref:Purine nucleoside phosphorylase n=1 Tax=Paenibacillus lacisoli TaxID=3064525 RepID=A0ABT9C9S1_9BACL|nr:peptidoglycan editing factor PgeF [Paenibacillus sp. JX-17]MDO7905394.1 peptidoglycan editing factor PgeF [Paenibacillus sp. JX-17]
MDNNQGPELLMIDSWQSQVAGLSVGFTSRRGGVSQRPYDSLNCAYHVHDVPEDVLRNRELVAGAVGFPAEAWTCGEQVHSAAVAVVQEEDKGRGLYDRESAFQQTDGLVTNVPGVLLTSFYADCVPLYFCDPVRRVVGLAHAGWKGTVGEIAVEMVRTMNKTYGSDPADMLGAIGPSIGGCCYEVDDYVMDRIRVLEQKYGVNDEWQGTVYRSAGDGKTMLDLKECNRHIMMKAGILPSRIEYTSWCTSCHPEIFYSYRKENGVTGRMASWIGLEER